MATARVAVLIDGSNLLGALSRIGLGYPNLRRLTTHLIGTDSLAFARCYGAPPVNAPAGPAKINYYAHWMRFAAAHRSMTGLDFYRGYREVDGKESQSTLHSPSISCSALAPVASTGLSLSAVMETTGTPSTS